MKIIKSACYLTILLLIVAALGCGRKYGPQTEFILEMNARDWLMRQTKHPQDSLLQVALSEMHDAADSSAHPLTGFERAVAAHGWNDRLGSWFPDLMPRQRTDDPMAAIVEAYDNDARSVQHRMELRLSLETTATLDAQMHVHAILDSATGLEIMHNLLLPQAELDFYETWRQSGLQSSLEAVRMATLEVDGLDTTFDLARLMHPTLEAGKCSIPLIEPDFAVVCNVRLPDTASLNRILHSPEAQNILPYRLAFAWSVDRVKDCPELISLIALRTQHEGGPRLDGGHVIDARQEISLQNQQPVITISMDEEGTQIWRTMTRENLGLEVAIVFDGYVHAHPMIQSEIYNGRSQISGDFTVEEAQHLARMMNAGSYPAWVQAIGHRPYLGE